MMDKIIQLQWKHLGVHCRLIKIRRKKKLSKYHLQSGCLLLLQNSPFVVLLFKISSFVANNAEFLF